MRIRFENRDTEVFMCLVKTFVADNSVMDTIRQPLAEDVEVKIGSFGKFTVITDLEGNKTAMLCSAKSLKQAITAGEGII